MLEKLSIEGKVAVVTGGGGGLGTAISLALAKAGADIIVTDIRPRDGERTAAKVAELGRRAVFIAADVTKSEEVNSMMSRAIAEWGKVDILFNVAGGSREETTKKPIWDITDREWHLGIDSNLTSAFFCSRAVAKHMVERRWGRIINFASGFGIRGVRNNFIYCPAKAGVILFTMSLALTLARDGIRVNVISPGLFRTRERAEEYETRGPRIPIGRVGEAHEIAALALYLASDASDYVTGQVFTIDGGALANGYAPDGYAPIITI